MNAGRVIPDIFVIGVAKAGTSSMYRWLGDHPQISAALAGETRYLMDATDPLRNPHGYAENGLDGYAALYPGEFDPGAHAHVLDVTPMYYYQETAKQVISGLERKTVVMILRNPSRRILSLYKFAQNNVGVLPPEMSFHQFVKEVKRGKGSEIFAGRPMLQAAIEHSEYARYVDEWKSLVGPGNLKVVIFEDFVGDPKGSLQDLAGDLGIDAGFYDQYAFSAQNQSYSVRNHWLHMVQRRSQKHLPGWFRRSLRPLYQTMNTRPFDSKVSDRDQDTIAELDDAFSDWNRELSRSLGRNDTIWSGKGRS